MRVGLDIGSTTIKCVVLNDAGDRLFDLRAPFQPYFREGQGAA